MSDASHARIYRPYPKTIKISSPAIILLIGLGAFGIWQGIVDPHAVETGGRAIPGELYFVMSGFMIGLGLWMTAGLMPGTSSVEISSDEIVMRRPLLPPKRVALSSVTGFTSSKTPFGEIPTILWADGYRTRKLPLPLYRADDGTLLRKIVPALVEEVIALRLRNLW